MKTLLTLLLLTASAFGQTATISDTIRTPFGGTFSGTVTVSLNSPALAQPLYSGSVTLSGWTQAVTVTAGVFTLTLYTNDLITPGGTSYTATYAPTSGSGWKETWIVPTGATTIREIRSTTVPSPSVRFTPSQITQAGATLGQGLRWNGSIWAPASVIADPMTTNGDLITRLSGVPVRVGIGSTNQVLTVSGGMPVWASGITGNASTATALAANGTNCSAGSFPLGVDASGNAESCTAAVTASTGLSDSADIVRGGAALSTPGSVPFVTSAGVLGQDAGLAWDSTNKQLSLFRNSADASRIRISNTNGAAQILVTAAGATQIRNEASGQPIIFEQSSERARFAATTGNLLLGTTTDDGTNRLQVAGAVAATQGFGTAGGPATQGLQFSGSDTWVNAPIGAFTIGARNSGGGVVWQANTTSLNMRLGSIADGNFRLDVGASGSSGTIRAWDQTPTTGSTSLVVRAGAGQTGNLFSVRNASNVEQFWVNAFGPEANNFIAVTRFRTNSNEVGIEATSGLDLASNRLIRYSSTTDYSATKDLSLSRASANTLQVGDGGANSNGTILARIHTWANGTEGTCDATLRGQVVMVQGGAGVADTFRVCRKDAADAYAWTALY